jgi:hypothetical protein
MAEIRMGGRYGRLRRPVIVLTGTREEVSELERVVASALDGGERGTGREYIRPLSHPPLIWSTVVMTELIIFASLSLLLYLNLGYQIVHSGWDPLYFWVLTIFLIASGALIIAA